MENNRIIVIWKWDLKDAAVYLIALHSIEYYWTIIVRLVIASLNVTDATL